MSGNGINQIIQNPQVAAQALDFEKELDPLTSAQLEWALILELDRYINLNTHSIVEPAALGRFYAYRMPRIHIALQESEETKRAHALTFYPGREQFIEDQGKPCFNLWIPPTIVPASGDVTPFLEHVDRLVGGDEVARD